MFDNLFKNVTNLLNEAGSKRPGRELTEKEKSADSPLAKYVGNAIKSGNVKTVKIWDDEEK